MKTVLLIRPKPHKETIGLQHVMVVEPLELEYLLGNVPEDMEKIFNIQIIDFILDKRSFREVLTEYNPCIVAFTGYNTHVNVIKDMAKEAKAFNSKLITAVGGVHAEVNRGDFQSEDMDLVLWKKGIKAFQALLRGFVKREIYNSREQWISTLQEEIDNWTQDTSFSYRPPKRSGTEEYRNHYYYMFHNPCALIKTSFGCPYQCSFCFCRVVTEDNYYTRPMQDVMEELKSIEEEEIYIVDDDFLLSEERIEGFLEGLEREKIQKRYLVYGRSDFIAEHPELMKRLKAAGLQAVIIGLESAKETDLIRYNKRTSIETNQKAIKVLQELDIEIYGTLILPMDYRTKDFNALKRWLKKMDLTFVNLQPLTPLKGTEIYGDYVEDFIEDPEAHEKWDMAHVVLKPESMSVRKYYFEIMKLYYAIVMRPKNLLRLIKKYGIRENLKMLRGSQKVSYQYLKKLLKG